MDKVLSWLGTGTLRRLIAFLVGLVATLLDKKLGIHLDDAAQLSLVALIIGYMAQSAAKEAAVAKAVIRSEAPTVPPPTHAPVTDDKVLEELRRGPIK